ncbi:MAG TPA: hypothetical protein VF762_15810 [Blastocatellia bacterium]
MQQFAEAESFSEGLTVACFEGISDYSKEERTLKDDKIVSMKQGKYAIPCAHNVDGHIINCGQKTTAETNLLKVTFPPMKAVICSVESYLRTLARTFSKWSRRRWPPSRSKQFSPAMGGAR